MGYFEALLLGLIEGLTEFIPVSSTGHLILAGHFLGIQEYAAVKAYEVVVQSGAIFAVLWHYRAPLSLRLLRLMRADWGAIRLFAALTLAFLPAAVAGLLFAKLIKAHLFGPYPVIGALVVGGFAMIAVERYLMRRPAPPDPPDVTSVNFDVLERMPWRQAFGIGLFQCLALWPGVSRSMSSILGGRLLGLGAAQAAEFSFLLAIPTLLAAGAYDLLKPETRAAVAEGGGPWAAGLLVSFFSALLVIRAFLKFVKLYRLELFGWYRILVGLGLYWLL